MKNILTVTFATLLLASVACAATNSLPIANNAPAIAAHQSSRTALSPGEGSPIPTCQPGHKCQDDLREVAGEGSPMPVCQPGHHCPDLREIAGEGLKLSLIS